MKIKLFLFAAILFFTTVGIASNSPKEKASILVEAECFNNYGGWFDDTPFMDIMGSPYLIAHGIGEVVWKAASICAENDSMPRDVYQKYLSKLKLLIKN